MAVFLNSDDVDFAEGDAVSVLTTRPVGKCLDYVVPEGGASIGAFVDVPLGRTRTLGVVWGPGEGQVQRSRLRAITNVLKVPPLKEEMRDFIRRLSDYTITPLSDVLRLATRTQGLDNPLPTKTVYVDTGSRDATLTDARLRVLSVLQAAGGRPMTNPEICQEASVSGAVVTGLSKIGVLEPKIVSRDEPYPELVLGRQEIELTEDQDAAASRLKELISERQFSVTLLKGVTGSGKTEVYLEAVAEVLQQGRQSLVLLPEIALTAQFLQRVAERFGSPPGVWHSGITSAERRRLWRAAANGGVQLVVGARSALFLPFKNLGLIVVDEEHDSSYKQEEGVIYSARDMSVMRGSLCRAKVVLCSATPSLETWVNARNGKYRRLDLTARYGDALLPEISPVDMRGDVLPNGKWMSRTLLHEVRQRIDRGEQSLLFINRRGYAPVTLCQNCGGQIGCRDCDARMVWHKFQSHLMCHQCGSTSPVPEECPHCEEAGDFVLLGPGVERLEEEAREYFPEARIETLSSDLSRSGQSLVDRIDLIARGEADIIIGTQLVAKGHNFPHLTLVGVIDADIGLYGSELRGAERTFQLIKQVSGRAGRKDTRGVALIQTWQPDHPVIRAIVSGDDEGFWKTEAEEREVAGVPPYGRYAGIILSSRNADAVQKKALEMARNASTLRAIGAEVLGPAPAPITRIRGRTRYRLLVKAVKTAPLQSAIRAWVKNFDFPSGIRLVIDIDPQRFN